MLVPKRAKYRKQFRGSMKGKAQAGESIAFGDFALKAEQNGWLSSRQIEAARRVMTRYTAKGGRVWIRIFPDKPITDKPPEVRMGGGKGDVVEYVAVIRPGRILFEMGGLDILLAKQAMVEASRKLPMKTRFITK
ncbi:50S ribosomal protein L16 [Candidatus Gottesmanbacteria bacterium]|nr:50S ribosomal protein L16 [Candidatus Gottesmanbacteria bacterium]